MSGSSSIFDPCAQCARNKHYKLWCHHMELGELSEPQCPCACGVAFTHNSKIQVASYCTILWCLLSKGKKLCTLLTWDGEWYGNVLVEIAERLNVAVSAVPSTCKKFENTGDVQSSKQPLRPQSRKLDEIMSGYFLQYLWRPQLYIYTRCVSIFWTLLG